MTTQQQIDQLIQEIKGWNLSIEEEQETIEQEIMILRGATVLEVQEAQIKRNGHLNSGEIPIDILDQMLDSVGN